MKKLSIKLFFLIFIVLFFITRLLNLIKFPLFIDEAFYVNFCERLFKAPGDFLFSFQYNTQPLFVWLSAVFRIFIKNPILATRLVSVLAGFLNLIALFFLVKKIFPKINKFFPLVFYLFLPFNLLYDRLALLESLTLLTISFALLAVFQLMKKPNFSNLFLLTLAFLLAALTKQIAFFGMILSALFMADFLLSGEKKIKRQVVAYFLWAGLVSMILFILISLLAVGSFQNFLEHFIFIPGEHFMSREAVSLLTVFKTSRLNFFKLLLWLKAYLKTPIFLLTLLASVYALFHFKERAWRCLLIWLATIVVLEITLTTIFYPRHLLPITTPIIILDSFFLTRVAEAFGKKTILLFLILFFPCLVFDFQLLFDPEKASFALEDRFQYFEDWTSGKGYDGVAQFLQERLKDKGLIVYTEPDSLSLFSLKFHPLLVGKEIIFLQEESLRDPIKGAPDFLLREVKEKEQYIIRNRNPGLPGDWSVELVREIPKNKIRKIEIYQVGKTD